MIQARKRTTVLAVLVFFLLSLLGRYGIQSASQLLRELANRRIDNEATRSRTYRVTADVWTEFDVLPRATALRISTNAALSTSTEPVPTIDGDPRRGFRYCIQYEILDRKGNVLTSQDYHFRAKLDQIVDEATGECKTASFFEDSTHLPTTTRTLPLTLERYEGQADRLRLRLVRQDAGVADIVARVFCRVQRTEFEDPDLWQRLSEKTHNRMTRSTVYPAELMTTAERREMLRWLWTPSAPIGMEGEDYETRRLYVRVGVKGRLHDEFEIPDGVVIHSQRKVTAPLPSLPGTVTVDFASLGELRSGVCNIEWFGHQTQEHKSFEHAIDTAASSASMECEGGLLQLSGNVPVSASIRWRPNPGAAINEVDLTTLEWKSQRILADANGEFDITPSSMSARMFKLRDQHPLEFSISHLDSDATPFQLQLRTFDDDLSAVTAEHRWPTDECTSIERAEVLWEFVNEVGDVVQRGELEVDPIVSPYDNLQFGAIDVQVTEPTRYYFKIPSDVAKVRVIANRGRVVASAFTRPVGAIRSFVIPDDSLPSKVGESTRRSWFVIRPDEYESLVNANVSVFCRTQLRPPEEKPHLASGDYDWEEFAPEHATSRYVLAKRTSAMALRDQAVPLSFCEVETSRSFGASWWHTPDQSQLNPTLIYQVVGDERPTIKLTIDGQEVFEKRLMAHNGEVALPLVNPSGREQTFRFDTTSPVRLFVNYLDCRVGGDQGESDVSYIKRLVHRIDPSMEFTYEKRSRAPELLVLRAFQPTDDSTNQLQLRLAVQPEDGNDSSRMLQPSRTFSVRQRAYQFQPPRTTGTIALGSRQVYDQGELCFAKLDEDLPAGRYKIRVDGTGDGYLLMFRSLPGAGADFRIHSEFSEFAERE